MEKEQNIESLKSKIGLGIKFWLIFEDKNILGSGWANLLESIKLNNKIAGNEAGSLTQAAKDCGVDARHSCELRCVCRRLGKTRMCRSGLYNGLVYLLFSFLLLLNFLQIKVNTPFETGIL